DAGKSNTLGLEVTRGRIRLAQPTRLLLEYTGTKYENKFYVCGEGNLIVCLTNLSLTIKMSSMLT
uniref:Uncharacterized protein n=1 Tax=Mola mola TaxID=94237 RepID=A0A3Q3XF85_MOLML